MTIVLILTFLMALYSLLALLGISANLRGRISLAAVFAFTGMGHFIKTSEMAQMLPLSVRAGELIVQLSGVFELLAAAALLFPATRRPAGIVLCVFLVAVFPVNIYAAFTRVDFGGHEAGPVYLLARLPLQILLFAWTWWFTVRSPQSSPSCSSNNKISNPAQARRFLENDLTDHDLFRYGTHGSPISLLPP